VHVPEEVSANGVQAHGLAHLQAVQPVFARDAGRMNLATTNLEPPTVEKKIVLADGEGMFGWRFRIDGTESCCGESLTGHTGQEKKDTVEFHRINTGGSGETESPPQRMDM
jgi:hypothetical protein